MSVTEVAVCPDGYVNESIPMDKTFTTFEAPKPAESDQWPKSIFRQIATFFVDYKRKIINQPTLFIDKPRPPVRNQLLPSFCSFIGAFIGMILLTVLHFVVLAPYNSRNSTFFSLLAYSFGATAVLVYDVPESPLAQPRNVVGGHLLSAIVGVTARQFLWDFPYISCAISVALAISFMRITGTTHPPGGATAAIAAVSREFPPGPSAYLALILPFLLGSLWLVFVAIVVNNLFRGRQYPTHWL